MDDIKIVAVVQFNQGEAYVLNRRPVFIYEKMDNILWASDSGFCSIYIYDRPSERWKAFAGREFDLPLKDGTKEHCYGQWWYGGQSLLAEKLGITLESVTIQTIEDLQKCYVFYGDSIDVEYRKRLRAEYTGCVYPYRDYEKVIKYDMERSRLWKRIDKLEKGKKHLIRQVKEKHKLLNESTK